MNTTTETAALTKAALKAKAQDHIMDNVARALGYWHEYNLGIPAEQQDEFRAILKAQADRAAKLYGYDEAWSS